MTAAPERRDAFDRLLSAIPAALVALAVLGFYFWQASQRKTPWVFTDELEWSQLSRSIASTGHAARRGEPIYFKSLYAYLIAPWWWISSTKTAYDAIKYTNTIVMTAAAIPTYLLARNLVTRRAAFAVAVASVCTPAMFYATSVIPEVLAYPYFALSSWVIVEALTSRRPQWIVAACALSGVALLVRTQMLVIPVAFAFAAAALWLTGDRARARRAGWTRSDYVGALLLVAGAFVLANRVVLQHVEQWQIATQYWKGRMIRLGLTAASALTIGLGIVPVVAGLASLHLPDRTRDPRYRAFAAYLGASIVSCCLYASVKSAYLSTVFATLIEERNLIYLAPLLLLGTALVLEARRVAWWLVLAGAAVALYLVVGRPYDLGYPYFEAPGYGIATMANRNFRWDRGDLQLAFTIAWAVGVLLLAAAIVLRARGSRFARAIAVAGVPLVIAWMLTAEITTARGSDHQANLFLRHLPKPLDWVDRAAGDGGVTYLGQNIKDPNGLFLTEFWNRSVEHVYSLDGTAPGPGPTLSPDLAKPNGVMRANPGTGYVLADNGVSLAAPVVEAPAGSDLRLYKGRWRLREAVAAQYADGWIGPFGAYSRFVGGRGTVRVSFDRRAACGAGGVATVSIAAGTLKLDPNHQPALGRGLVHRTLHLGNCAHTVVALPVPTTPFHVEMHIAPTFRPSDYGKGDVRDLGAQVGFTFVPARG